MSSIQDNIITEEQNQTNTGKPNNWAKFFIYCIVFFLLSLFILVLGSNFIFISNTDDSVVNNLLPININAYFKPDQQDGGGYSCGMKGKSRMSNWPYYMRKSEANTRGLFQRFKNWFAVTTAETFIMNRKIIREYVPLFSSVNNIFLIFLISILTISLAPLVFIGTLGTGLFNAFKTNWKWATITFFLMFLFPFVHGMAFVQFLQYIYLFVLMPGMTDMDLLKDIIKCNINIFFMLFGALVFVASAIALNPTITMFYMCLYGLMTIISII